MKAATGNIVIRPATENDVEGILSIYNDIILNNTAIYQYEPQTLAMRKEWFAQMKARNFPVFVAEKNGMVAGFSYFSAFRAPIGYQFTVENTVHVDSAHRGQGIGKLLMPPIIDAAKRMKFHAMVAGIDAGNEASVKLHQRFGFTEVAHFKQVGFKFGRWLDLAFYELLLEEV